MGLLYSVVTYMFGDYDMLRDVAEKDECGEYICVTDNPSLTSETWTVVVDDYLRSSDLTPLEKTMYAKTGVMGYAHSDVVISVDASVQVLSSLSDIVNDFINGGCDMRLALHYKRDNIVDEIDEWIRTKRVDASCKADFLERAAKVGFDFNTKGLIEATVAMFRNNKSTRDFFNKCRFEFFEYAKTRRPIQGWMTYLLEHYYSDKLKLEFYGGRAILYSKWFQLHYHDQKKIPPFDDVKDKKYYFNGVEVDTIPVDVKKNNVVIFVGAHRNFDNTLTNEVYKVLCPNDTCSGMTNVIKCELPYVLKDWFYSEMYMLTYAARNLELPRYVGFCHYRKHFKFENEIPDFDEVFTKYDVCTAKPVTLPVGIREQYGKCHNVEDLDMVGEIIGWKYKEYKKSFDMAMKSKKMFPYNMFVMKREDFLKYIDFMNGVLDEYIKMVGTEIDKRVNKNKKKYLKKQAPNNDIEYQKRIGGYLAERLTTVFILKNFKTAAGFQTILTEKIYPNEKITEKKD